MYSQNIFFTASDFEKFMYKMDWLIIAHNNPNPQPSSSFMGLVG